MLLGNCKLNNEIQLHSYQYSLKKLTVSACEDVEQQEPSSLQVGMKNETVLEDSLAVF